MARQETKQKITSLESQLNTANDVSAINSVVEKTTKELLDTTQGVHMTQAYKDQLATIASKLDEKKKVLEEKRKQLTEEKSKLVAEKTKLESTITNSMDNFNRELTTLRNTKCEGHTIIDSSSLPSDFASLS